MKRNLPYPWLRETGLPIDQPFRLSTFIGYYTPEDVSKIQANAHDAAVAAAQQSILYRLTTSNTRTSTAMA